MGRRPLEWVLAILGQVEAAGSQGGTPGHSKGGRRGVLTLESDGAKSLNAWPGTGFFLEARESSATHARSSLPFQRDSVSPRLPPQPGAWPRPHRTRWRRRQSAPLRRRKAGAEAAAEANRGNLEQATTAHALTSTSEGHRTLRAAAHEVPSRPPVPECPDGPLLRSLPEPRWDPPLCSGPASADATQFEPAEGGGVLGHALPRPCEWTSRGRWEDPPSL